MNKSELYSLMEKVKRQDEAAFENLFNACKKGVFSFLYTYTGDYHLTEDLLQETFIKVKQNAQKFNKGTNASAWILQIAKNTALDYLRKEKQKFVDISELSISDGQPDISEKLALHDIINRNLLQDERQIVILHLAYGYKNREIAEIMEMPVGTVLWKYNRALKRLKEVLKEGGYE